MKEGETMNEKFIKCKDSKTKEELIQKGFKLLSSKIDKKGDEISIFINNSSSLKFSKEDNEGLSYSNTLYF